MRERNLLIRASAGTGKTFSLATRYIQLLLLDEVDPAKIVALTFSRAAAQEIYTKILERLWTAAESDEQAAKESKTICGGLGLEKSWDRGVFARLLRRLIDAQHLGTIATLDSFVLRMVRNFPLEMGFQHAVEVLDQAGEDEALEQSLRLILNGTDAADDFVKAFTAAREGNLPRVLQYKIAGILRNWRKFHEQHRDCAEWTVESMCAALGIPERSVCPDLSGVDTSGAYNPAAKFVKRVSVYDGSQELFTKDRPGEMMRHFVLHPEATSFAWDTDTAHRCFNYGVEGAAAIRAAIRHMFNLHIRRRLAKIEAQIKFVDLVERLYDRDCRRRGRLTFSDFTRVFAAKEGSEKALKRENIEYRFDEKFDHWELDEFQDTSELQWACLRNLVQSAAESGDGRTVMTVGDLKQSIYTWRGGNDAPFKEMMSWGAFNDADFGRIADSDISYRYEGNICAFVNAVFGPENLRKGGVIPAERAGAVDRWLAADCWKDHKPDSRNGRPKAGDYVKVLGVREAGGKMADLLPALEEELRRIWEQNAAKGCPETIGVLVRRNDDGTAVAEYLRAKGFPVVWEGLNAVSDVPVVNALVDLLRLSEHPEDSFAWTTVSRLFPICSTLFASARGDLTADQVSREVAASLSHRGLSRTLQSYCRALSDDAAGLDELSKVRLREMVRVAVAYEQRDASRFSIDGFETFLAASSRREQGASSRVVRILTVHRSKGLTLDRVFVPLAEGERGDLTSPSLMGLFHREDAKWVLSHLSMEVAAVNPEMTRAWNEMADERLLANVRTHYVALTRARRALHVILPLVPANRARPYFRDLVESAAVGFPRREVDEVREIVFEKGTEPSFVPRDSSRGKGRSEWRHEEASVPVERLSPSSTGPGRSGTPERSAIDFFSENFGLTAKKGIERHAAYAVIEWAGATELAAMPEVFRAAFAKPSPDAMVWRERGYEIYREANGRGLWETGQFDRVVFSGEGANRSAVIYDFKTNAVGSQETEAEFEERMRTTYSAQMTAYRSALRSLTGLPAERIRTVLLLQATGKALPICPEAALPISRVCPPLDERAGGNVACDVGGTGRHMSEGGGR